MISDKDFLATLALYSNYEIKSKEEALAIWHTRYKHHPCGKSGYRPKRYLEWKMKVDQKVANEIYIDGQRMRAEAFRERQRSGKIKFTGR